VVATIRTYEASDEPAVVALALRAWAPVFASMRAVLGDELDRQLHGDDWRAHQAAAVRGTLDTAGMSSWVADAEHGVVVGFASAIVRDADAGMGEIEMLAVDPDPQGVGTGARLTEHATTWLREQGVRVAMVETGGDPGHAPARATYAGAGYTAMPVARFFKAL
jgi:GNAT superfamily N-acetyltransferase